MRFLDRLLRRHPRPAVDVVEVDDLPEIREAVKRQEDLDSRLGSVRVWIEANQSNQRSQDKT